MSPLLNTGGSNTRSRHSVSPKAIRRRDPHSAGGAASSATELRGRQGRVGWAVVGCALTAPRRWRSAQPSPPGHPTPHPIVSHDAGRQERVTPTRDTVRPGRIDKRAPDRRPEACSNPQQPDSAATRRSAAPVLRHRKKSFYIARAERSGRCSFSDYGVQGLAPGRLHETRGGSTFFPASVCAVCGCCVARSAPGGETPA